MPPRHDRTAVSLPVVVQAGPAADGQSLTATPRSFHAGCGSGYSLPARSPDTRPQPGICRDVAGHPDTTDADSFRRLAELNRPPSCVLLSLGPVPVGIQPTAAVCYPRSRVVAWSVRFSFFLHWSFPMNGLILWTALACVPFVPATLGSQNAGCPKCDCCGCCETGSCECNNCTCTCCLDECPTAGRTAEREACGSGCCSR